MIELKEVSTRYESKEKGQLIGSPSDVAEIFAFLKEETKEKFVCAHLNTKNHLISYETVSVGSLNASLVHPREVFKAAILSNAASVVLIHNHPSGDAKPSKEDAEITKRLKEAGTLLGIELLDHVIIGDTYHSIKEDGSW